MEEKGPYGSFKGTRGYCWYYSIIVYYKILRTNEVNFSLSILRVTVCAEVLISSSYLNLISIRYLDRYFKLVRMGYYWFAILAFQLLYDKLYLQLLHYKPNV